MRLFLCFLNIRSAKSNFEELSACTTNETGLLDLILLAEVNVTNNDFQWTHIS